jgi:hypothetical protein
MIEYAHPQVCVYIYYGPDPNEKNLSLVFFSLRTYII